MIRKYRFLVYAVLGSMFGICTWYIPNIALYLPPSFLYTTTAFIVAVLWKYSLWLLPVLPLAITETHLSQRILFAAMAVIIVWVCALTSYYTYYAYLIGFVGLNQMEDLLFSRPHTELFWRMWADFFRDTLLDEWLEWSPLALFGGGIVGSSISCLSIQWQKRVSSKHGNDTFSNMVMRSTKE